MLPASHVLLPLTSIFMCFQAMALVNELKDRVEANPMLCTPTIVYVACPGTCTSLYVHCVFRWGSGVPIYCTRAG